MTLVKVDSGESSLVIVEKGLMFWAWSKLENSSSERRGRESIAMQGEIKCVAPWRGTSLDMRTYVAALANRRRPSHGGWELRLESQKLEPEDRREPHYYVAD